MFSKCTDKEELNWCPRIWHARCRGSSRSAFLALGTLRRGYGEGNENVKISKFNEKKQLFLSVLLASHLSCFHFDILLFDVSCKTSKSVKWPNLKSCGNVTTRRQKITFSSKFLISSCQWIKDVRAHCYCAFFRACHALVMHRRPRR